MPRRGARSRRGHWKVLALAARQSASKTRVNVLVARQRET
jgi:hypothetical protein